MCEDDWCYHYEWQKERRTDSYDSSSASAIEGNEQIEEQGESLCPPVFNFEFTDFSKIDAFQPIGSIGGASPGRSYITIKQGETVPVYAPMDATLKAVVYAYRGPQADHGEYGLKFDTKCGITFFLDHLDSVSEEMNKYAPAEPARSTAVNDILSIPVKAGTLLGYTDGTSQARTFDFLATDSTKKAFHINPDRWVWEQSLYSICPYDLYEGELKEKYYQKIGISRESGFEKAENCGNISYDIENTISGGWFKDDAATDRKGEFMLIGERDGIVDLAVKRESEAAILRVSDSASEESPKDIGIGESVCYEEPGNGWAYVKLVDSETIELASGSGSCPSSFPASNSKTYYR